MLVAVDALRFLVLLMVDELLVGGGEMAVVLCAHGPLFVVDGGLLLLDVGGLAGGELAALDALSDTVLLVDLALVDGGVGGDLGGRWGLGEKRGGGKRKKEREGDLSDLDKGLSECFDFSLA